jgi:hypothetical protein
MSALYGEVNRDKEGKTPIQESGGGTMMSHKGEPADAVPLGRFGWEEQMGFPAETADQPFLDPGQLGPIPPPSIYGCPLQAGL